MIEIDNRFYVYAYLDSQDMILQEDKYNDCIL